MKVGNNIESLQTDLLARAVNGNRSPATPASQGVSPVEGVDKVELSALSQRLSKDTGAVGPADGDIRLEKVAEVRQAMDENRFQVNAHVIAQKMISQAAELIESIATRPDR